MVLSNKSRIKFFPVIVHRTIILISHYSLALLGEATLHLNNYPDVVLVYLFLTLVILHIILMFLVLL